jgi:hypothetical protein
VFVPFNQPGLAANELLGGSFTTAVRIEPAAAQAEVEPAAAGVAEGAA